ncbi:hypothetical protein A1Q1_05264 [Trichosporon asahii var. asahii CBS 2479]|uniref:Uncharacterized protein n=1 Tax=Trichosporon asahii var. asahii (strain ATCC 90039 / CBS 2479 / JCM 2466 / KCTC 7840 / NBRC 103889/ NCYC 2677 / UAMH 7654) TaxID=1186058 RepID=J8TJF4_TRIAS|nr:hypothetical protein A1Q1_05264 [Trichosporon asahii var. asahii CBS 2479]EJT53301.1 hypothetical protein A1Q1_05264 [Trichosporon asahii var. asahii CBS 2479]
MSFSTPSDPTKLLIQRENLHNQICTHNLATDAPGPRQSGQNSPEHTSAVIAELQGMLADNVPVESVAMTHDYAEIVITDSRGLNGSMTVPWMATIEQRGEVEWRGRNREVVDEYEKDPGKYEKMNEEYKSPRPLVVTYNVSREVGPPFSRQSEGENGLQGFVEELKRLKEAGAMVLAASFTPQTAVITVDAPKGL